MIFDAEFSSGSLGSSWFKIQKDLNRKDHEDRKENRHAGLAIYSFGVFGVLAVNLYFERRKPQGRVHVDSI